MPHHAEQLSPHAPFTVTSTTPVRSIYIHNLVDLLHVCLLKGHYDQARRAWAILIRCREIDWRSRWNWGLALLDQAFAAATDGQHGQQQQTQATQASSYPLSQIRGGGSESEQWLNNLQTRLIPEPDKPAVLHARILHMIKRDRHRAALSELELWLVSYPYATSGPLHTYAGLLAFYLAQPESARLTNLQANASTSPDPDSPPSSTKRPKEAPNPSLLRGARNWFVKALELDTEDQVARDFIRLIDEPDGSDNESLYADSGVRNLSDSDTELDEQA